MSNGAASSTADPAICVQGLGKRYGEVTALHDVDLEVPRGSIFGFLGPNGSGKTTTMRILLGLARPTSGTASVLGFDVVRDSLEVRRRVGYLAQLPRFYEDLTPRQTLRFARGFFPHDADHRVEDDLAEALDLVGLRDKADHRVGGLSGGQRQRLGIAQAYVHRPPLLVLDEPAAALDPLGRRDVLGIMRRLQATTTIFYSTHILDDVERVSDTVAVLHQGTRVAQAPIGRLLADTGAAVFLVELRGGAAAAARVLGSLPWVRDVETTSAGPITRLRVTVDDVAIAERRLLRELLGPDDVQVTSFVAARRDLEQVFVDLVGEGVT